MAEIFTDEGLDYLMARMYKNATPPTTLYLGLFKSQTATTVPARTATGGATPSGWSEVTGTSYARIAVASTDWGSGSTNGSGRKITAAQKTFTAGGLWDAANGFFVSTASASGSGDTTIFFANFDDGTATMLVSSGDQLKVTASAQHDG